MDHSESGIFQSIRFWQGWAVVATLAALFTFAANIEYSVGGYTPDYVAVLGEDGAEPLWVVNANLADGTINVRAAAAKPAAAGEAFALWLVGPNHQRLGVLPVDRARKSLRLTDTVSALLAHGKTLGVSRESVAGEAAAEPRMPWLYKANLARL